VKCVDHGPGRSTRLLICTSASAITSQFREDDKVLEPLQCGAGAPAVYLAGHPAREVAPDPSRSGRSGFAGFTDRPLRDPHPVTTVPAQAAWYGFSPGWADRGRQAGGLPSPFGSIDALISRTDWYSPHARRPAPVPGRAASWREDPRVAGPRPPDGWKFTERAAEFRYLDTTPLAGSAPAQRGTHAQ
jgi:hypothetical protein